MVDPELIFPAKMRHFRSILFLRIVVSLTLLSVGSVSLARSVRADSAGSGYAEWLKLHLPGGLLPQIQDALDRASEAGARSFDDFLEVFLEEITSEDSERSVGYWITGEDVEDDVVIQELRRKFNGLLGTAILNRQFEATPSTRPDYLKKRLVRDCTTCSADSPIYPDRLSDRMLASLAHFDSFGLLRSSAQPLGP